MWILEQTSKDVCLLEIVLWAQILITIMGSIGTGEWTQIATHCKGSKALEIGTIVVTLPNM